jgi:L-cystine transport system substrate-binding protein
MVTLSFAFSAWGADISSNSKGAAKIRVGMATDWQPFLYVDEDGNLAGYDYEVLRAVDELLPQYAFEFETYDFSNLFLAIDSGKIDIAASQIEKNEEREARYLFTTEYYNEAHLYIIVNKDRDDINSLDDLRGKKAQTTSGTSSAYILEQYNKTHQDNPIILEYYGGLSDEEVVAAFKVGKWDAQFSTRYYANQLNSAYGDKFKTVGEPISASGAYCVFKKGSTELQKAVDGALRQLRESGKLSQLSIAILGGDYTS